MDLSTLNSSLPLGLADAERDMGDKFRAAALSITNLYKSSLSYTKQAYHVGYSACLSDVLSTVQSSIGAGQDATQTLSRLMDWAEAREAAMAAFAADDIEDPLPPPPTSNPLKPQAPLRSTQTKQALNAIHSRATSAPPPLPSPGMMMEDSSPVAPGPGNGLVNDPPPRRSIPIHVQSSTPISDQSMEITTPLHVHIASSTATSTSTPTKPVPHHNSLPIISHRNTKHRSPVRFIRSDHNTPASTSINHFQTPTTVFQPILAPEIRKFAHSYAHSHSHPQTHNLDPNGGQVLGSPSTGVGIGTGTGVAVAVGSKRPLMEVEMSVEEPVTPARTSSGRSSKRRTLGKNEESEEKERVGLGRRGGKRGHGGGGLGSIGAGGG